MRSGAVALLLLLSLTLSADGLRATAASGAGVSPEVVKEREAGHRKSYVDDAAAVVTKSNAAIKGHKETINTKCIEEITSIKGVVDQAHALTTSQLTDQKEKLEAAMRKRVEGMTALIGSLNKFVSQIVQHQARTNEIYQARHEANSEAMKASTTLLQKLGLLVQTPNSPSSKKIDLNLGAEPVAHLNPIPAEDKLAHEGSDASLGKPNGQPSSVTAKADSTAAGAAGESAPETTAVKHEPMDVKPGGTPSFKSVASWLKRVPAFIEMSRVNTFEEMVAEAARQRITPPKCTTAWEKAFSLYKKTYDAHTRNNARFEEERVALREYLLKLKALIDRKTKKRAELQKQIDALNAITKYKDPNVGQEIEDSLEKHKKLVTSACPTMVQSAQESIGEADAIISEMRECSNSDFGTVSSNATLPGSATTRPSGPETITEAEKMRNPPVATDEPQVVTSDEKPVLHAGSPTITHLPGTNGTSGEKAPHDVEPAPGYDSYKPARFAPVGK